MAKDKRPKAGIDRVNHRKEERKERRQAHLTPVEDIRDEVISVVRNSKLTFRQVNANLGPAPSTLKAWADRRTHRPQINTVRGALRACGYDLAIVRGTTGEGHLIAKGARW